MTKHIKEFSTLIFSLFILSSCAKKELINNTEESVGVSKVIFFPSIETNGDQLVILYLGEDTYTDEGATAILNGEEVEYTTVGSVDASTPGVYDLSYEAKNAEGYSASDFRTVVVIDAASVTANDYSGGYDRYVGGAGNGQSSFWTKTGVGVYNIDNPGGATGLTVTGVNYEDNKVVVPFQTTSVGGFKSTEGTYNAGAVPPFYEWSIINGGYGAQLRTFKKK